MKRLADIRTEHCTRKLTGLVHYKFGNLIPYKPDKAHHFLFHVDGKDVIRNFQFQKRGRESFYSFKIQRYVFGIAILAVGILFERNINRKSRFAVL